MKHPIRSSEELGLVIRAVRKSAKVRQDDLAGIANVSRQFAVDAERGKETLQVGKLLKLLEELGVALTVEIPDEVEPVLRKIAGDRETRRQRLAHGSDDDSNNDGTPSPR